MADIFVSYSSKDRERVKPVVDKLIQQGWSIWWDRKIPLGKTFDQVIEEELDAARCVLVIWSKESVKSKWVRSEAREGEQRQILIPVLIDDVVIPLEFRSIQAARLIDWKQEIPDQDFDWLIHNLKEILLDFSIVETGPP